MSELIEKLKKDAEIARRSQDHWSTAKATEGSRRIHLQSLKKKEEFCEHAATELARLTAENERLEQSLADRGWKELMELLDEHWPDDIFPTTRTTDEPARDAGARIVAMIRWIDELTAENAELRGIVEEIRQRCGNRVGAAARADDQSAVSILTGIVDLIPAAKAAREGGE